MSPFIDWFSSSGICIICNKYVNNAVNLSQSEYVYCDSCYQTREFRIREINHIIDRIERRENSLLTRIGISFGLMKSQFNEIELLRQELGRLKKELKPIEDEFERRFNAIEYKRNLREKVMERAGYKCEECGRSYRLSNGFRKSTVPFHIHHIKLRSEGGDDSIDNLKLLCEICHSKLPKHELIKIERNNRLSANRRSKK